ncbi:hypothetical protein QUF80_12745 [Desulfococcaceae bacterium HSG8]|nr:hypothetical protein [Desulfococcaceae bacterium HSG8]
MAIDRKKIIEEMSKVSVIGNDQGLIPAFGVYVQQLPGVAHRFLSSFPIARLGLVNPRHRRTCQSGVSKGRNLKSGVVPPSGGLPVRL